MERVTAAEVLAVMQAAQIKEVESHRVEAAVENGLRTLYSAIRVHASRGESGMLREGRIGGSWFAREVERQMNATLQRDGFFLVYNGRLVGPDHTGTCWLAWEADPQWGPEDPPPMDAANPQPRSTP